MKALFTMWRIFTSQVILAVLSGAQNPDFQLQCPQKGFTPNSQHTVQCTVQGNRLTGCFSPVDAIMLQIVDPPATSSLSRSGFPNCTSDWNHPDNNNGRCVRKSLSDVYVYEFNVTVDPNTLTNNTYFRCYADCSTGPGNPNPFTHNSSETCGPPVKFEVPTTTGTPITTESITSTFASGPPDNCIDVQCKHGEKKLSNNVCACDCSSCWTGAKCEEMNGGCIFLIVLAIVLAVAGISTLIIVCCCDTNGNIACRGHCSKGTCLCVCTKRKGTVYCCANGHICHFEWTDTTENKRRSEMQPTTEEPRRTRPLPMPGAGHENHN